MVVHQYNCRASSFPRKNGVYEGLVVSKSRALRAPWLQCAFRSKLFADRPGKPAYRQKTLLTVTGYENVPPTPFPQDLACFSSRLRLAQIIVSLDQIRKVLLREGPAAKRFSHKLQEPRRVPVDGYPAILGRQQDKRLISKMLQSQIGSDPKERSAGEPLCLCPCHACLIQYRRPICKRRDRQGLGGSPVIQSGLHLVHMFQADDRPCGRRSDYIRQVLARSLSLAAKRRVSGSFGTPWVGWPPRLSVLEVCWIRRLWAMRCASPGRRALLFAIPGQEQCLFLPHRNVGSHNCALY